MVLDSNNQVYLAGSVKNAGERQKFTHTPLPNEAQLDTYSCGRHAVMVLGTDQKFYWWGKNKFKHFQENDT